MTANRQGAIDPAAVLGREFFLRAPTVCARELIGMEFRWEGCSGIVVETEAYSEIGDEACHTFFRPGARRFVETHEAGAAYVYFNYGMYWLTNVLTKDAATGERGFVLLRALRPVSGLEQMRGRRGRERDLDLCSGPGKLSMALGITGEHHGQDLVSGGRGFVNPSEGSTEVVEDVRVGISRAKDLPWRYLARGSRWVSRPPAQ